MVGTLRAIKRELGEKPKLFPQL